MLKSIAERAECEHCAGNDMMFKDELLSTKKLIVIRIVSFLLQDGQLMNIQNKINLCAVPRTKILTAGHFYKVMNSIFHHGSNIDNGHYTNICREGTSNIWIEADDTQIKKKTMAKRF